MMMKMKNILYLDCFSRISGDMTIGALIDAGLNFPSLLKELEKLELTGYRLKCREAMAGAVSATKFDVEIIEEQKPRSYKDIKKIITGSSLPDKVKKVSLDIFKCVAVAEAKIHNRSIEEVHFHEVGAIDSIIDIVGTAIGIQHLKIDRVYCSHIPLGSGKVDMSHGKLPIPAPATLEILKGVPVYQGDFDFEVTTPTGAAIVKTLAAGFGKIPDIEIKNTGYGAGTKNVSIDNKHHHHSHGLPNVLRAVLGREVEAAPGRSNTCGNFLDKIFHMGDTIMLSTNIDDSTPEIMGYVIEKLNTSKGVLDAWLQNIYMKKNRPAFKLNIICTIKEENNIAEMIFKETSTLGIRRETVNRYCLDREKQLLKLPYGEIEIKVAKLDGEIVNSSPEYESCKKLAKKTGKPLKDIYRDIALSLSKT
jgi:pyridinium-3,5-bisthiocarboxylic acid mononucleotide nickel chelatase